MTSPNISRLEGRYPAVVGIIEPQRWLNKSRVSSLGVAELELLLQYTVLSMHGMTLPKITQIIKRDFECSSEEKSLVVDFFQSAVLVLEDRGAVREDIRTKAALSELYSTVRATLLEMPNGLLPGERLFEYERTIKRYVAVAREIQIIDPYVAKGVRNFSSFKLEESQTWLLRRLLLDSQACISIVSMGPSYKSKDREQRLGVSRSSYSESRFLREKLCKLAESCQALPGRLSIKVLPDEEFENSSNEFHNRHIAFKMDNKEVCFSMGKGIDLWYGPSLKEEDVMREPSQLFQSSWGRLSSINGGYSFTV